MSDQNESVPYQQASNSAYPQFQQLPPQQQWGNEPPQQDSNQQYQNYQQQQHTDEPPLTQPLILGDQYSNEDQPQRQEEVDKFLYIIKIANMAAGAFVTLVGFYLIVTLDLWQFHNFLMSFYSMFLPIFYMFFGMLLIAAEYYKEPVNIYFRFVRSYLGRGIFNIFLATQSSLAWYYPGMIFGWILMSLGVIYIFLFFIRGKVEREVKDKLLS